MWKLASVSVREKDDVEAYLGDGYEPFAITADYGSERLWLKKEVNEADNEPDKPGKRGSRQDTPKSEEEDSN